MITPKIKALFQFIEFLHSNIENFNQYNDLIKELETLKDEKNKLKPELNYKDKLQYNNVQTELESKFKILQDNTASLIKAKAKELNICNFDNEPNYSFNSIETDISQLKENFSKDDLPEIFKRKQQYIEYRTKTHSTFLSLAFFIDELDEITKNLFDYFKDTEQNKFDPFETKAIMVNDISEAVKLFKQGHGKFTLPNIFLNQSAIQQQNDIETLPPQQMETEQEIPTFTNNFDNIKPTEIYKHFKAGLVDKGYLTDRELNEYLKEAFELKTPEKLFKLKHTPTKQKIYTVFYVYYKDISQKKHKRQKEYAALLGDYFEGYKTEIIQTNWAREYKTKR